MRTLYLLRHAKSSRDDPTLRDRDRPLTDRGVEDMRYVAAHVREVAVAPDVLLCSAARRTRQTLDLLDGALPAGCEIRIEDELYGATVDELLGHVRGLPDDAPRAMLIGHNPAIQRLSIGLADSVEARSRLTRKYPTGALATLVAGVDRWAEVAMGVAELAAFVRPKDLGAHR